ncbi:acetyl/propionyl/methylcrotonyl-CoA carboxylase subunit alpha [Pontibacillus sp. HMF3514]|uniref:acetyl-CoA carboxylase biotin carboxylase subunit n=1 Tax=Pontibacillus sp. HMF3514 TaxID=2692425 RepID=UPI0013203284|nr:acetyl-CoA carboxylase biotin carboxylase subunit [Pontibacillus sp. HMF3514]QHE52333.1 acetyl-CoA carboxylase biotin carboxylase subunit [Pontibacillus sp. HMF3514]
MFNKILIANRGEIASRIIRTCKKLGIQSVAVYSDPDADSPFVSEADESYPLGGTRVHESYLNIDKILEIAKEAEVEAIHPGYGLLSENGDFANRIEQEGITFIGPSPEVMSKMGSKVEARQTMKEAGVPVIPGTESAVADVDEAKKAAKDIGYPVMLKASSGGGGIGMQIVHNDEELAKAFESNSKRAQMFFGDGTMFLEKKIVDPHHVEIQVLADQEGNTIHLFERECSIQRRHQKVVEEAPSPFISQETRNKMGNAAVKAAKAIGYKNAGTIEFLVDEDQNFYFLEMNTRLQVEHPVTEEITGFDLVHEQLRIANGDSLRYKQEELTMHGHAIEVRVYAEDPKTFYPAPGQMTNLELPYGDSIRHEVGVHKESMVSPFYDPMIAKCITWAETRDEAIERMIYALENYTIEGIKTNIPMLLDVLKHDAFKRGNTNTHFIQSYYLKEEAK